MMEEIAGFLPQLKTVLLDERDEYLATNIMQSEGDTVLAVLGAAHVPGIKKYIEEAHKQISQPEKENTTPPTKEEEKKATEEKLAQLNAVSTKKKINVIGFLIPLLVLGLFGYGFYKGGAEGFSNNFFRWWIINGGLSLLGSIIALANPITMIASFLAAPLTSLNPFIGIGLVTGLSETFFRPPKVRDFEDLQNISLSVSALYKNRVTRILLVFVLTTLGSAAGTFIGISVLATST